MIKVILEVFSQSSSNQNLVEIRAYKIKQLDSPVMLCIFCSIPPNNGLSCVDLLARPIWKL